MHIHVLMLCRKFELIPIKIGLFMNFCSDYPLSTRCDFMKVLHQYPNCLAARVNLALLLHCEGKFMTAWTLLTNVLSLNKCKCTIQLVTH